MTEHWTYCKPRIHTYIHTRRGRTKKENRRVELGKETKKKKRGGLKSRPRIKKNKIKKKKGGAVRIVSA